MNTYIGNLSWNYSIYTGKYKNSYIGIICVGIQRDNVQQIWGWEMVTGSPLSLCQNLSERNIYIYIYIYILFLVCWLWAWTTWKIMFFIFSRGAIERSSSDHLQLHTLAKLQVGPSCLLFLFFLFLLLCPFLLSTN